MNLHFWGVSMYIEQKLLSYDSSMNLNNLAVAFSYVSCYVCISALSCKPPFKAYPVMELFLLSLRRLTASIVASSSNCARMLLNHLTGMASNPAFGFHWCIFSCLGWLEFRGAGAHRIWTLICSPWAEKAPGRMFSPWSWDILPRLALSFSASPCTWCWHDSGWK